MNFVPINVLFFVFCFLCIGLIALKARVIAPPEPIFAKPTPLLMFFVSMTGLYTELLLIRWIGTEVRIFAYIQNLALISCFLGFGVGCFKSDKPQSLLTSLQILILVMLIIYMPGKYALTHVSEWLTIASDIDLWGGAIGMFYYSILHYICGLIFISALLWLIALSMVPFGNWIGYAFNQSDNTIRFYNANLIGSLLGAWLLALLSLFNLSLLYWLGLVFLLLILLSCQNGRWPKLASLLAILALIALALHSTSNVYWSPYQKLEVLSRPAGEYQVNVNNTGYMSMANTTQAFLAAHPQIARGYRDSVYDSPFRFAPKTPNVLIVGAGAGNDASAALRNGAKHVDAVEIDPMIYRLGKELHPDQPYSLDKVSVIINDARNFLRSTDSHYDVIIFGLLDSHTESSSYTNLRIDNYVYTKEAITQARKLLNPDGVLILKFEVRDPWFWIGQRHYRTITEVFGRAPITYRVEAVGGMFSGTVYVDSNNQSLWERASTPALQAFLKSHPPQFDLALKNAPIPSTDDWPYPYNHDHSIPHIYLVISAILLLIASTMIGRKLNLKIHDNRKMFFLGAGFLLLETQLISRLSLYFGTTWIVNCIAISVVLLVLVSANIYIEKGGRINHKICYLILLASIIGNYFFPWEDLLLQAWEIGLLLSLAYAISVLMAGLIFTSSFRDLKQKAEALGANIFGAVAGGLSQSLSFIFGLKSLLLVAAFCYICAAALGRNRFTLRKIA